MSEINNQLAKKVSELKEFVIQRKSISAVKRCEIGELLRDVLYHLEHEFNPSPGIWRVEHTERMKESRRILEFSELPIVDRSTIEKLESRRYEAIKALTDAVEKTKKEMPDGTTWWTYAPNDIIDEIFRAISKNGE